MKEIDLVSLRLLAAVCDAGNIARAAEKQHTVPSAVSKRISQLEADMGVSLLTRTRRGVRATAAGEALLGHARTMFHNADRARRDMHAFKTGVRGKVRLLATVSAMAEALPSDIAAFLQHPQNASIQVDMEESFSRDIARSLHAGMAAAAVCWDAADLTGLNTRPYRSDHLAVVTHPSHPLAQRAACSFAETLEYEHVGLPEPRAGHALLARAAADAGRPVRYRAQLSSFDGVLRFVAAGLGISVAPVEIAGPLAQALGLALVPLSDAWATRHFVLAFGDIDGMTPAAEMLIEFLASRASRDGHGPGEPAAAFRAGE